MKILGERSLSAGIKRILDILWILNWVVIHVTALCFVVMLLLVVGATSFPELNVGERGVNLPLIDVEFELSEDLVAVESGDGVPAVLRGGTGYFEAKESNFLEATLFFGMALVASILSLIGLKKLREIFQTFKLRDPFHEQNVARFRTVGFIMVAGELLGGLSLFAASYLHAERWAGNGVELHANFPLNFESIVTGLFLFVLAEIFKNAGELQREMELTV